MASLLKCAHCGHEESRVETFSDVVLAVHDYSRTASAAAAKAGHAQGGLKGDWMHAMVDVFGRHSHDMGRLASTARCPKAVMLVSCL